ncbi:hypothetical protein NBO_63g0022 [Nosema bombycis CQ1]|uniref:Uncharacterized protein n=1 Tax=Nosema bombycis (strain CQ1 / CVCC 102059) TaxID=578461 RepID=R0MLJ6_NOSB1|nr:hypothetical protein NBO_63g0022 [Nosema bombycis CQ1]|eukprot:EOB13703.1 hypothetical protein NBO_63g0022 [Nosema bombycis CQ1]
MSNPLKELFSLTNIIRNFEKERIENKPSKPVQPLFSEKPTPKPSSLQHKGDVLDLVRTKFDDAIDLSKPKKKLENVTYRDSPLFFHPIGEVGSGPFDNISNLTDFTGSISSTVVKTKEIPNDDSKEVKSKVLSKVVLDIKSQPKEESKSSKSSDESKSTNESKSSKSSDEGKLGDDIKKEKEVSNKTTLTDPIEDIIKKSFKTPVDELLKKSSSKPSENKKDQTTLNSPDEEFIKKSLKPKEDSKSLDKEKSPDNFNEKALNHILKKKSDNSLQLDKDRQVEQEHLQKDKVKRDNSLFNEFEQIEKEFNEKKEINKKKKENSEKKVTKITPIPISLVLKPMTPPSKRNLKKEKEDKERELRRIREELPPPFDNIGKELRFSPVNLPEEEMKTKAPVDEMKIQSPEDESKGKFSQDESKNNISQDTTPVKPFPLNKIIATPPQSSNKPSEDEINDASYSSSSTKNEESLNQPDDTNTINSPLKL